MTLYNCPPSGNCYKVRLSAAFNPWRQVPAVQDGGTVLWGSRAILVYLAECYQLWERWARQRAVRAVAA